RILFYEGTIQDISERRAMEEEREMMLADALARQDLDPLTGLLNHRAFQKRFDDEAAYALTGGYSLAAIVIDLDNFRFFNEVYGYQVGDELLIRVAGALRASCRSYDCMARFGGDEFVLLMPGACAEDVASLQKRLTCLLERISYHPKGSESAVPLSVSTGVALFPEEAATRVLALELAIERLHRVKSGGRDNGVDLLRASIAESVEGFAMIYGLVSAVDNKDRYTRHHSEDVMVYCLEIAERLGWSSQDKHILRTAALLHDVGKIGVPDSILRKPGALTAEEVNAIKEHPTLGAVIVGAVPALHPTLDAVRYHHECWDGSGYPAGLAGQDIPPMARVMAVADAYSAMTTDRPYRKGMDPAHAMEILRRGAGQQWDPECVAAFLSVREKEYARAA
ncbi:MAG: diguanylate cyclase, partial [Capsulimonas sp.]|uniref:diguanylate cyclase n=1 Tax=Capsulimonas sp. TaxID=2494211 RepID=UPI003264CDD3